MRTVIIGNGIIAITTALRLALRAKEGDKIIIVGKRSRPGSATLAAAAMLNSFCEVEEGSLDSDIDLFRFELSYQATKMWPQFVLDHMEIAMQHNCLIGECATCMGSKGACFELGTYLINNCSTDSLDDANYNAVIKALNDFLEPYHQVDPKEIPNYKPHALHRANRAIYIPNEGWLNPKLTIRSLEVSVENFDSVEVVDDEVDRIVKNGQLIESVILKNGAQIQGDKFLLTTGATASDLIDKSDIGINIPRIFYSVGVSIQINSPGAAHTKAIRTPNRGLACGIYTVPFYTGPKDPLNEIIIGASSYVTPWQSDKARVGSVQYLLNSAIEQINADFYKASVTTVNVGSRPLSADTYPVIGRTSIPNLIIATGTKRDGFHLSPVISEVLTKLVYDEEIDPRYEYFSPQRKLIRQLTRQEAIETSIKHLMNASYQHGFVASHDKLSDRIIQMHRTDLETLHDKAGAYDWGIPPELIDMYRYGHIN
jgi:glycine/D-amino acid oxidase-like deaminating enzyme